MLQTTQTPLAEAARQHVTLRDYQYDTEAQIYAAWANGAQNVLSVLPTGAGKTVLFAKTLADCREPSVAIAHRQELVSQISVTLARYGVRHKIIGPRQLIKTCVALQMQEVGRQFYDPNAKCAVAGVDTLKSRQDKLGAWPSTVRRWVIDEAHHVLGGNKWGAAVGMFPYAWGLGVTATPTRADGFGLGRHADGVFDELIVGPTVRELIQWGYLTDYRIVAAQSDLEIADDAIGKSGDYSQPKLKAASRASHIVGDVVQAYLEHARGMLGVTFVTDVETAKDVTRAYNDAGIPAEVVTAKTPDRIRAEVIRRFRRRELLQLVNVDLFGEGFDLPAIEVVSMARPTASFSLYSQQFGRVLRPIFPEGRALDTVEARLRAIAESSKQSALVIDHVGNWIRHGLPDSPRVWSLDRREKKKKGPSDEIPCTTCTSCLSVYERRLSACPFCGFMPEPMPQAGPEQVDGDLTLVDPSVLERLRAERAKIDGQAYAPRNLEGPAAAAVVKNHRARQQAQEQLRDAMAWWLGYRRAEGLDDAEIYRRFYFRYRIDVFQAQTLGKPEAETLTAQIWGDLANDA